MGGAPSREPAPGPLPGPGRTGRIHDVNDAVVLFGLLLVAAVLRFAFLATRGTWDADQGHDMLVLHALVTDGRIPLLGPPTSIGDFHHGAAYYYLLAPLALVSGADPTVVVSGLAAAGTAAVAVTWWLARSIGDRLAGAIAGLLIAVSPSAIEASTFLWNPNAIALTAAVALAAAWRAHATGRVRWWAVAGIGVGLTMQLHVLGIGLLIPVAGLYAWTWRRGASSAGGGPGRPAGLGTAGLTALAIIAALYVPLLIHELTSDFAETRAALAYLSASEPRDTLDPVTRLAIILVRIVAWPLVGLVTEVPIPGLVVTAVVLAIVLLRWRTRDPDERLAVRWFGLSIAWSALFLSVAATGLTTVVAGLPNDHYHAFVDPMVFALVGLGLARVARGGAGGPRGDVAGRTLVAIAVASLVVIDIGRWPPPTASDGGWPAARKAAARVAAVAAERPIVLSGLPLFKSTAAYAFPLVDLGRTPRMITGPDADGDAGLDDAAAFVVVCDRLFEPVLQATCGGPAEDGVVARHPDPDRLRLADRFDASTRTVISVYLPDIEPPATALVETSAASPRSAGP